MAKDLRSPETQKYCDRRQELDFLLKVKGLTELEVVTATPERRKVIACERSRLFEEFGCQDPWARRDKDEDKLGGDNGQKEKV